MIKDENLSDKLIKKGSWLYIFSLLIAPSWYIIRILISNDLSVSDVWIIYSIISFITLISIYNDLWFTASLIYHIPKFWIKKQYNFIKSSIFISLVFQIFTSIILIIVLFFWSNWLAINYFQSHEAENILKIFCLYFLWINIYQILTSIFIAFQDTFYQKFIEFIKMWTIVLFTIFFFSTDNGSLINYTYAWLLWLLVSVSFWILIFFTKYKFVLEKWKLVYDRLVFKNFVKYSLLIFIWSNISILLWQIDLQMVLILLWPKEAWYYSNYLALLQISTIIIWPIFWFLLTVISEIYERKQKDKIILLQNFFYKFLFLFAISLWWILFTFWPVIAIILFWEKFIYSWEILRYSSLFIIFNILFTLNLTILAALWMVGERLKIIWKVLIINISLNTILINLLWIQWAIIATVISWIMMYILSYKKINTNIPITFEIKYIIKNIIYISIFLFLSYNILNNYFIYENIYRYHNLIILLLIIFMYIIYLWLLNYKELNILKNKILSIRNKSN